MILNDRIRLRPVQASDLPRIFDLQSDPESNRMAVTNRRDRETFDQHWATLLDDPTLIARAILLDDRFVGTISCFAQVSGDHIGYWIDRAFWGHGVASQALALLLHEVTRRPLLATVATSNLASLRVLQKHGFTITRTYHAPASERYPASDLSELILTDELI